jgi:hypothetical protein
MGEQTGETEMTIYRRGDKILINDNDREQWIDNDEGLYNWWRSSRMSKTAFIKENRKELGDIIRKQLEKKPRR